MGHTLAYLSVAQKNLTKYMDVPSFKCKTKNF